jgi:hypothetical protein
MRASVAGFAVALMLVPGACARLAHHGGKGTPVDLKLNLVSGACKATVTPDPVYVSASNPRVTWTVTDACNQTTDEEAETQLVFKYQPHTPKKWLDPEIAVARTKKHGTGTIKYKAKDRGQAPDSSAKYSIFYDGDQIADPKVVWGR